MTTQYTTPSYETEIRHPRPFVKAHIGALDVIAFIVAAVMILGPLAMGARSVAYMV
jgi:hypothetical protein